MKTKTKTTWSARKVSLPVLGFLLFCGGAAVTSVACSSDDSSSGAPSEGVPDATADALATFDSGADTGSTAPRVDAAPATDAAPVTDAGQPDALADAGSDAASDAGALLEAGPAGHLPTDAKLKVAFIGDTNTGANLKAVLALVKAEGAAGLVIEGDMSYADDPTTWWADTESVLGSTFPIFISHGNHDDITWDQYLPKAQNHLDGAVRTGGPNNANDSNYKTVWRGLMLAAIMKGDTASTLESMFAGDDHMWKVCQWHQNQTALQTGVKTDEMGWDVYETCRANGAIIETGHEHSYARTKTLTNLTKQTVSTACPGANDLCVGPGVNFVNVVGLGGVEVRAQQQCLPAASAPPYGACPWWAKMYNSNQSASFGAQFITFNDGAPTKATGYFKDVNAVIADTFNVTYTPAP